MITLLIFCAIFLLIANLLWVFIVTCYACGGARDSDVIHGFIIQAVLVTLLVANVAGIVMLWNAK